jgi:disulfide bond formation protein DsbB
LRGFCRVLPIWVCLISVGVLGLVFIAEYVCGIKACEWCMYQRYPYVFLLVLNFIWLFKPLSFCAENMINTFILAINAMLPLVHVLIEKGYINVKCGVTKTGMRGSIQGALQALSNHRSCVKVTWECFGWSMAQWHLVFATCILIAYIGGVMHAQKRSA